MTRTVYKWFDYFCSGYMSTSDAEHSRHPVEVTTVENSESFGGIREPNEQSCFASSNYSTTVSEFIMAKIKTNNRSLILKIRYNSFQNKCV